MKATGLLTYSAARLPPRHPGSQAGAAAILLSMAVVTAQAANIEVTGPSRDGVATITVEGTLLVGDGDKFQEETSALRDAIVVLRSDGDSVFEGIKIGEIIRRKGFSSLVVDQCASACAVAWLGGTHRFMAAGAQIGFHAAYDAQSGQQTGYANARVGAYLNRIGLTDDAVTYTTAAPPNSMVWLTNNTAQQYGIDLTVLDVPDSFYVTEALARIGATKETVAPRGRENPAKGPSFDCTEDFLDPDEVTICKSDRLAVLDRQMVDLFASTYDTLAVAERPKLLDEQHAWLQLRAACRKAERCIADAYRLRITRLRDELAQLAPGYGGAGPPVIKPAALKRSEQWAVIASAVKLAEAISIAHNYQSDFPGTLVIQSQNRQFAVTIGPVDVQRNPSLLMQLIGSNRIPKDSYYSAGARFDAVVWPR
jgi:uncharacterized protein